MKRIFILVTILLISSFIFSDNVPQIYVHGTKSEAKPLQKNLNKPYSGGWTTWYPLDTIMQLDFPMAMTRIVEEGYAGYKYGKTIDGEDAVMCDKNTELMTTNYPKSVYNFSYYREDGGQGII